MNSDLPFKAVTVKHQKLCALPHWVFHPLRRTENNRLEMRDSAHGRAPRSYLPFEELWNESNTQPVSLCQPILLSHCVFVQVVLTYLYIRQVIGVLKRHKLISLLTRLMRLGAHHHLVFLLIE